MKTVTKTRHSDASHSWLSVNRKELIKLGIESKISRYSYQGKKYPNTIFLEEDVDMPLYLKACKENNIEVKIKDSTNSRFQTRPHKIRGYNFFQSTEDAYAIQMLFTPSDNTPKKKSEVIENAMNSIVVPA